MNSFEGGANGCDCPRDLPPPPPPFLPVKLPLLRLLDFNDFNDDPLARSTLRFSLGGGLVVVVVVIIIKSFAVPTYPHSKGTEREGHAGLQFVCVRVGGFCTRTSAAFVVVVILKSERNTNENMMRRRRARYAPTSFCISPFEKKRLCSQSFHHHCRCFIFITAGLLACVNVVLSRARVVFGVIQRCEEVSTEGLW